MIDRLLPRVLSSQEIINTRHLYKSAVKNSDGENELLAQVHKLIGNER